MSLKKMQSIVGCDCRGLNSKLLVPHLLWPVVSDWVYTSTCDKLLLLKQVKGEKSLPLMNSLCF